MVKYFASLIFAFLLFAAAPATAQGTYSFECYSGARLTGDTCDICPSTIVESRSFNGLIIWHNDTNFYKWIDQPYSIRVKPGNIVEYWEHGANPYSERVTIPLSQTDFFTVQGMADSTWCNFTAPNRYQELYLDSLSATLAKARLSGSNTGFGIRAGTGISFDFQNDTLAISASGGSGTVTSVDADAPAEGFTISGVPITTAGTMVFTLANDLSALEGLTGTGIAVRTGTDAWTTRVLVGGAGISITNSGGLAGNPTITNTDPDQDPNNELQTYSHAGTTSYTNTLSSAGGSFTLSAGSGVSISHNGSGGVTIATTGGTNYQTFRDDGVAATQRANANFVSTGRVAFTLTDDAPNTETEVSADIVTNSIGNTYIRQSAGLSVIGRSANSTGNVADITAGTDGFVLRRSGTTLGFGTVATAGIADDAVTYAKLQNVAANNVLLGNDNGVNQNAQELTVAEVYTLLGLTGVANRFALWTGTNTLSSDAAFTFDAVNDRMTVNGTVAGSGANNAFLNLNSGAITGTTEFWRASGNINGNMYGGVVANANNTANGNAFFQIAVGGTSAGDPAIQMNVPGGVAHVFGIDNSDGDKMKLTLNGAVPGENGESGFVWANAEFPRHGINISSPLFPLDVSGVTRSDLFRNTGNLWDAADLTFGVGAGTGPSVNTIEGGGNCVEVTFTTGTAPTANGNVFTLTYPNAFGNNSIAAIAANDTDSANAIGDKLLYISTSNATTLTVRANGTLPASTQIVISFVYFGY